MKEYDQLHCPICKRPWDGVKCGNCGHSSKNQLNTKNIVFLLLSLTILFFGCSKNEDGVEDGNLIGNSSALVGRWAAVANYTLRNGIWEEANSFYSEGSIIEFGENGKLPRGWKYEYNPSTKELKYLIGEAVIMVLWIDKVTTTELEIIGLVLDTEDVRKKEKTAFVRID